MDEGEWPYLNLIQLNYQMQTVLKPLLYFEVRCIYYE